MLHMQGTAKEHPWSPQVPATIHPLIRLGRNLLHLGIVGTPGGFGSKMPSWLLSECPAAGDFAHTQEIELKNSSRVKRLRRWKMWGPHLMHVNILVALLAANLSPSVQIESPIEACLQTSHPRKGNDMVNWGG